MMPFGAFLGSFPLHKSTEKTYVEEAAGPHHFMHDQPTLDRQGRVVFIFVFREVGRDFLGDSF